MANPERALLDATQRDLARYPPFDSLEADALAFLAGRLSLGYHARGALLLGPGAGVADRLYIVRRGCMRGGIDAAPSAADPVLGPGECFPLDALVGRRASEEGYRAVEDTFCWELPAQAFHELMARSARFRDWCTDQMAALLARAREARRAEASALVEMREEVAGELERLEAGRGSR